MKLNELGLHIPSILLPKKIDAKWPVIACDQFTQDRNYWQKVKETAGDDPSAINLIFPEVYLQDEDAQQRISAIHRNMTNYLRDGVFAEPRNGFIYIERDTPYNTKRRGLITAIDLEKYDWRPDSRPVIRCTEGTVEDRLPPRMAIRRGAPLELPHILLLIDDDTDSLLPAIAEQAKKSAPVYQTELLPESGRAAGWFIDPENSLNINLLEEKLNNLYERSITRYEGNNTPFLLAVGDGNHSLAAAKGIWEEYKIENRVTEHPLRYALVEIENIYDPAIQFEPIHRVLFGTGAGAGIENVCDLLLKLPNAYSYKFDNANKFFELLKHPPTENSFGIIGDDQFGIIATSASGISTASLQPLLDDFVKDNGVEIDYIHDEKEVIRLTCSVSAGGNKTGILLPPVQKSGLFETVARTGPLPRKSFSMGHSCEKRFYLESRKIK